MGQVGPKGKTDEQPLSVLLYLYNEEMVTADASPWSQLLQPLLLYLTQFSFSNGLPSLVHVHAHTHTHTHTHTHNEDVSDLE